MRKASLSISTNAIVILIVAVIMLGLIIGLVTRGFGAVEKKFLGQIEDTEPEPPTPSTAQPITLSSSAKIASRDELVGFKVNIMNPGGVTGWDRPTSQNVQPVIECKSPGAPGSSNPVSSTYTPQAFSKSIPVGQYAPYTLLFRTSGDISAGTYLCRIQAKIDTQSNPLSLQPAEFRLTIEE